MALLQTAEEISLTGQRELGAEHAVHDWLGSSLQVFTNASNSFSSSWAEPLRFTPMYLFPQKEVSVHWSGHNGFSSSDAMSLGLLPVCTRRKLKW